MNAFRDNTCMVLQRPAEQRKKLAALDRLITTQMMKRTDAFKNWRDDAKKASL